MKKKIFAIIVIAILAVCLVSSIVNFSSEGGMHDGDSLQFINSDSIVPGSNIYKGPVDISLGYTPYKNALVLYSTYEVTDSSHKTIDSSLMLHIPFSSEYIISKKLTNLANGNYTFTINAYLVNGTVHVPFNQSFIVDSTFQEPKLTVISPQNQTYNTGDIDVTFNVDYKMNWAYYKLDSSDWTRFYGNMTLHGLSEGHHVLTVSVRTEVNQFYRYPINSQTTFFDIAK